MNTAHDYRQAAQRHRPTDPQALAIAVQDLAAQGLTLRDIAVALRMDIAEVLALLNAGRVPLIEDAAEACARVWNRHAMTHGAAKVP